MSDYMYTKQDMYSMYRYYAADRAKYLITNCPKYDLAEIEQNE